MHAQLLSALARPARDGCAALVAAAAAAGCGDGAGPARGGSLEVDVAGLPASLEANIVVNGPDSFSEQVTSQDAIMPPGHGLRMALLVILAIFGARFAWVFVAALRRGRALDPADPARRWIPKPAEAAVGVVTVFFDTFGIGSFATTTAAFRALRLVPDELLPGTLNVGHAVTSVLSAFIFIELVPVAASTLLPMIAAAGLGAWLGSGIVARLPRHRIRIGMGSALIVAASLMLLTQLGQLPAGADTLALTGPRLAIAVAVNFVLGGLMTLGIGLYAPCMILVSLLGMNPRAAFPIMMGSCALLLPISGARFVREGRFHPTAAVGLTLGGIPALLVAAYIVRSLPIHAVRWIVIVVVLYTALTLLDAGRKEAGGRDQGARAPGRQGAKGAKASGR